MLFARSDNKSLIRKLGSLLFVCNLDNTYAHFGYETPYGNAGMYGGSMRGQPFSVVAFLFWLYYDSQCKERYRYLGHILTLDIQRRILYGVPQGVYFVRCHFVCRTFGRYSYLFPLLFYGKLYILAIETLLPLVVLFRLSSLDFPVQICGFWQAGRDVPGILHLIQRIFALILRFYLWSLGAFLSRLAILIFFSLSCRIALCLRCFYYLASFEIFSPSLQGKLLDSALGHFDIPFGILHYKIFAWEKNAPKILVRNLDKSQFLDHTYIAPYSVL